MKKKFVCTVCGYIHEGEEAPAQCPQCKAPASKFKELVDTELTFVTEHVIGIAKDVDPEIKKGLQANFEGECTEVGMEAESGACSGKMDLAKMAKQQDLDAIHDTVHEMAKDEARHGRGFAGLYNRYFGDK